jgi:hypothetical protein
MDSGSTDPAAGTHGARRTTRGRRPGRPTLMNMSAPREELHRLIDALPEETVPVVLAELRSRTAASRPWPPRWFGAAEARRPDVSERVDDILRDELGRRGA